MNIHFSIDDTIKCFKYLESTANNNTGIFSSTVLKFGYDLHYYFGINVTYYCLFTDGVFSLDMVSDLWQEEFHNNSKWLKFGFHGFNGNSNYSNESQKIKKEYELVINNLVRITGGNDSLADIVRLHYFAGSRETVRSLSESGVNGLLCADDERGSYDLNINEELILKKNRIYIKDAPPMQYLPTDIRVENYLAAAVDFEKYRKENCVYIFTHEKLLDDIKIKNRTIEIIDKLIKY